MTEKLFIEYMKDDVSEQEKELVKALKNFNLKKYLNAKNYQDKVEASRGYLKFNSMLLNMEV